MGAVAVMVNRVVWFDEVALVSVPEIFPDPLAAIPVIFAVLVRVQA